jgi:ParB-like chromosome segregation protein Spo0J
MTEQGSLFESLTDGIIEDMTSICQRVAKLPLSERVETLNRIHQALHAVSPFAAEPVDCVQWIPIEQVEANDYNPNRVAPPEMRLLEISIREDGYTQPIVGWQNDSHIEVVDGYHRRRVGKESKAVAHRIHGYLPVALIQADRTDRTNRIAATIRHNRARGVHAVMPMTDIVAELLQRGWTDDEVARELGMDADEVLRFKQNTGLPELFKDSAYSRAWE